MSSQRSNVATVVGSHPRARSAGPDRTGRPCRKGPPRPLARQFARQYDDIVRLRKDKSPRHGIEMALRDLDALGRVEVIKMGGPYATARSVREAVFRLRVEMQRAKLNV
jgi:hypothetical protein